MEVCKTLDTRGVWRFYEIVNGKRQRMKKESLKIDEDDVPICSDIFDEKEKNKDKSKDKSSTSQRRTTTNPRSGNRPSKPVNRPEPRSRSPIRKPKPRSKSSSSEDSSLSPPMRKPKPAEYKPAGYKPKPKSKSPKKTSSSSGKSFSPKETPKRPSPRRPNRKPRTSSEDSFRSEESSRSVSPRRPSPKEFPKRPNRKPKTPPQRRSPPRNQYNPPPPQGFPPDFWEYLQREFGINRNNTGTAYENDCIRTLCELGIYSERDYYDFMNLRDVSIKYPREYKILSDKSECFDKHSCPQNKRYKKAWSEDVVGPPPVNFMKMGQCRVTLNQYGIKTRKDFLKWSAKNHPDKGGNEETFQIVNECVILLGLK